MLGVVYEAKMKGGSKPLPDCSDSGEDQNHSALKCTLGKEKGKNCLLRVKSVISLCFPELK